MASGVQIGRGYIAVDVDDSKAQSALRSLGSLAASAFKAVTIGAGIAAAGVAKMAFEFNSLKEQSLIAFETLLGSGAKAQQMFSNLQKFAATTPFELPGLVDNARQLLGVGVAGDKVIPTLTALGNAAGALGINQERFNNILLATTQAMGKGKLQGEELMQMVENGIPVWQLLAKATGKPVPELQKLSSEGKLIAQDVLPKLFEQMQKDYGGAMAKQSQTLSGVWSSLKDNAKLLAGTALEPLFSLVKTGVGALGELAASDGAQKFAERFADGIKSAITASRSFILNVKRDYGDEFRSIFNTASEKANQLWDTFKDAGVPILKDLGKAVITVLPAVLQLAQTFGGLLRPILEAVRTVMSAVGDNADELAKIISTAAGIVNGVAGPAIQLFGTALQALANVLSSVINLVGALSGVLGPVLGIVITGAAAFRLFGTGVGAATAAVTAAKAASSDAVGFFGKLASKADDVALSAGVMTEKFTKSANAGQKVADAGGKVGSALRGVGSILPALGIGLGVVGLAFAGMAQHAADLNKEAEQLGQKLAIGGSAGREAAQRLDELRKQADAAKVKLKELNEELSRPAQSTGNNAGAAGDARLEQLRQELRETEGQVKASQKAMDDYKASLGPVGLAQAQLQQAQSDYNDAVSRFGPASSQAVTAHAALVGAQRALDLATRDANNAIKTQEQSLYDLATAALTSANADLTLRQSQSQYQDALANLAKVQGDATASANQRRDAEYQVESAALRAAAAARQKAEADNAGKAKSDIAAASNAAYAQEILRMAAAAGTNAPASLQKLVGNLDAASLSAIGAKVSIDSAGNAVIALPNGKNIPITAENAQALREVAKVQAALAEAQERARITMTIRVANGLPAVSDLKLKARGGPVGEEPYIVGEQGPELFVPNRSGFIHNTNNTQRITDSGIGSKPNGDTFNIYDATDPYGTALYVQRVQRMSSRLR